MINRFNFGHGVVIVFIMQSLLAINSEKLTVLLRFDLTRHLSCQKPHNLTAQAELLRYVTGAC